MPRKLVPQGPQGVILSADNPVMAFLEMLAGRGRSPHTARAYVGQLRRFEGWLGENYGAGLLEATAHDVQRYRAQLAVQGSPHSVNTALSALRQFYGWAVEAGRLKSSPAREAENVELEELAPSGFSDQERRRLEREADKAGPMADAVVTVLLHTGLRVSELVGLTWEKVSISPRSGWARVQGKRKKVRDVPLNLPARKALEAIRPEPATGPVFQSRRGPYSERGIRDLLSELGRRANVEPVYPHRCRHDAARQMLRAGIDMTTAAKILGHRRLDTLSIYTQPSSEDLQKAVAALETE